VAESLKFPAFPRASRQLLSGLTTPAAGMSVQQKFLDVISQNLANVETTRTADGGPYKRQVVTVSGDVATGEASAQAVTDPRAGRTLYDPGHPDADADGFVAYPNVDVNTELVDLMVARRVFEANATVFQAAKAMLRRALDI
jgi:flagellar basal-body rod protein FlgC